jgi:hypothetical protein
MRFPPRLAGHRELHVDVAAFAAVAAGVGAALAILTQATAAAAVAVIGIAVMVVTLRRPSPWLTTANDLTLSLVFDDLDACLAAAWRAGTEREGSETEAALESVTLLVPGRGWRAPDVPTVRFRVREPDGDGWRILAFDRPPRRPAPLEIDADGRRDIASLTVPPWRLDPSWRQLLALSWIRMQPFVGTIVLRPLPGSRRRRHYWEISYRSAEPASRGQATTFRLRSTGLYRPSSLNRSPGGGTS